MKITPEQLKRLEADAMEAAEAGRRDAADAEAEFAAAKADPNGPAAKRLRGTLQVWDALLSAGRDRTDPMQLLESRIQTKRATARGAASRAFVLKEWAAHAEAYEFNKTRFAQDYRGRLLHEFGVKVSVRQIAERWLKS
jgi:hypothetical protein